MWNNWLNEFKQKEKSYFTSISLPSEFISSEKEKVIRINMWYVSMGCCCATWDRWPSWPQQGTRPSLIIILYKAEHHAYFKLSVVKLW